MTGVVANYETDGPALRVGQSLASGLVSSRPVEPRRGAAIDGASGDYRAVPVTGEEHERVDAAHPHSVTFRILTGFPPRRVVRLDPR